MALLQSIMPIAALQSMQTTSNSMLSMQEVKAFHPITLITFDVDGTLVQGSSHAPDVTSHAKAFLHGAGKVMIGDDSFELKHSTPLDFIPGANYHGCTDGLISLHLIKRAFDIPAEQAMARLPEVFEAMHAFITRAGDADISSNTIPIAGVLDCLSALKAHPELSPHILCGLVTGNVEGIARQKMRATGIFQTGLLARPAADQLQPDQWPGTDDCAFLGGFGSDYCSGDIEDISRQYKDRGEQIVLAYQRACSLLEDNQRIVRVVHVGDAPADVLAAKYCAMESRFGPGVVTGCLAVATGSFSAEELQEVCGVSVEESWEPTVLANGVGDVAFTSSLKIRVK